MPSLLQRLRARPLTVDRSRFIPSGSSRRALVGVGAAVTLGLPLAACVPVAPNASPVLPPVAAQPTPGCEATSPSCDVTKITVAPQATTSTISATAPSAIKAFDTTAVITDPQWFRDRYAEGFRLYIVHSTEWGTTNPWWRTVAQTRMALDAGLMVAGYTRDPSHWEAGIRAFGEHGDDLAFFVLDIETDPGVPVTRAMVDGIAAMGVQPVIYTGRGMWFDVQGATANDFADVPLWDTDVMQHVTASNHEARLDSPAAVPYAGWNTPDNMRVGVQQSFDTVIDGVMLDLDTFDAGWLSAVASRAN
jgi:hypothetical protein